MDVFTVDCDTCDAKTSFLDYYIKVINIIDIVSSIKKKSAVLLHVAPIISGISSGSLVANIKSFIRILLYRAIAQ